MTILHFPTPHLANWQIGALFGVLTSCIAAASKLTIRKSWLLTNKPKAKLVRVCGMMGMSVLNPIFDLLAMSFANPSLLSGFSGLALALIVLFSGCVTGETPSRLQIAGCALIVLGQGLCMSFGDHSSDVYTTIDDVVSSYRRPTVILYLIGMTLWMALLYVWKNRRSPFYQRLAWGLMSGSITGVQCFLKDSLTVGKRLRDDPDQFTYELGAILVAFLCGLLISALGGLFILTACMQRYDATYSNAMHAGSFVVSCSIMSWIRYQTTPVSWHGYAGGLTVILGGVAVLVKESLNDGSKHGSDLTEASTVCSDYDDDEQPNDDERAPLTDEEALLVVQRIRRTSSSSSSLDSEC